MQMQKERLADERAVIFAEHTMELQALVSAMSASNIRHQMLIGLLSITQIANECVLAREQAGADAEGRAST